MQCHVVLQRQLQVPREAVEGTDLVVLQEGVREAAQKSCLGSASGVVWHCSFLTGRPCRGPVMWSEPCVWTQSRKFI